MANSADPDPTDLDLPVCKDRTYPGSAGQGLRALILYEQGPKNILIPKSAKQNCGNSFYFNYFSEKIRHFM